MGRYAFDGCSKLKFLEFSSRLTKIFERSLDGAVNCNILVPNYFVTPLRTHHENLIRNNKVNGATTFQVFDFKNSQDVEAFNRLSPVLKYKLPLYFSKKQFELDKELYSRESKEFIKTVLILMNRLNNQVVHESILHAPIEMWFLMSFITRMEMNPKYYWKFWFMDDDIL